MIHPQVVSRSVRRVRRGASLSLVALAGVGSIAGLAHADDPVPYFPPAPVTQIEVPAGSTYAVAEVSLPGLCVVETYHWSVSKELIGIDPNRAVVTHASVHDVCSPQAGFKMEIKTEKPPLTGLVSLTLTIVSNGGESASYLIEFYLGVPIPAAGGEVVPLSLAALTAVLLGVALVVGSQRRRAVSQ